MYEQEPSLILNPPVLLNIKLMIVIDPLKPEWSIFKSAYVYVNTVNILYLGGVWWAGLGGGVMVG